MVAHTLTAILIVWAIIGESNVGCRLNILNKAGQNIYADILVAHVPQIIEVIMPIMWHTFNEIPFIEYVYLVSMEIWDVKMPPNFTDWDAVHKFLREAHAMNMSVENAARGILEQFGHGETIN